MYYKTSQKIIIPLLVLLCYDQKALIQTESEKSPTIIYYAKKFNFSELTFLTEKQKQDHYTLYTRYVDKLNEIRNSLATLPRTANTTYSEFRSLKIAETFALNGALLHELYFENIIGKSSQNMGPCFKKLLLKSFESEEQYLKDLKNCAGCARGWAITAYSYYDNALYNFVLDAHNETVPAMTIPLVIIDTYEHAYMIDFGIDRATYLSKIFEHLQWDIIEERTKKMLYKPIIQD